MKSYPNRVKTYFPFLIICVFFITTCTQWAPRVNRYALPQYEYEYQMPAQINDGWETECLSIVAVDSEKINELIRNILNRNYKNIHSVLLVKNGKLILEEYFYESNRDQLHHMQSAGKSITSILIGIAIDQQMIPDVEKKVYKFFPEYEGTRWVDNKYDINISHLLTMTAGLDWDEVSTPAFTDSRNTIYQMGRSDNQIEFVLQREAIEPPGERFNYNGGLSILLGGIIQNVSDLSSDTFAEEYLFSLLGISRYRWYKYNNKFVATNGGLFLTSRDMAKIGYLMLKGGKWKGQQIVSRNWVYESTKRHVIPDSVIADGYGYHWWCSKGEINKQIIQAFYAAGHGGQFIFAFPSLDLVAVFTSKVYDNPRGILRPFLILNKFIIPAIMASAPKPKAIVLDAAILDKYVGKYKTKNSGIKFNIIRKHDKIYLKFSPIEKTELFPIAESSFLGTSKYTGDFQISFVEKEDGKSKYAIVHFTFWNWRFDKIN